ncbi:hypothetical protein [Ornithinimicrobium sp. INDO-MA30-4]|uniref:hypothetical protein n=1 Tax=Ornithinimicrobium sp. INDO-MA30-4 TaxID=2908651 RepID=UPI001F3E6AB7|nr:hypothetical protein [Ornithinimicrobium sp. INDO-MA30-4]UJH69901.1 hypothetical protein L0A91_11740 [Ornithinimicrobium sp. INDO-MA30-4]
MSHETIESAADAPAKQTGWDRWGWLMAVIWLPFLIFSIAGILEVTDGWQRALALGLVAVFAGFYVHGFVWRFGTMQPKYATAMGLCILGVGMLTGLGDSSGSSRQWPPSSSRSVGTTPVSGFRSP